MAGSTPASRPVRASPDRVMRVRPVRHGPVRATFGSAAPSQSERFSPATRWLLRYRLPPGPEISSPGVCADRRTRTWPVSRPPPTRARAGCSWALTAKERRRARGLAAVIPPLHVVAFGIPIALVIGGHFGAGPRAAAGSSASPPTRWVAARVRRRPHRGDRQPHGRASAAPERRRRRAAGDGALTERTRREGRPGQTRVRAGPTGRAGAAAEAFDGHPADPRNEDRARDPGAAGATSRHLAVRSGPARRVELPPRARLDLRRQPRADGRVPPRLPELPRWRNREIP